MRHVSAKLSMAFLLLVHLASSEWSDPTSGQYHIQTDEGPERYFRYQTNSGQYRKEKRLEDGTVIGSYAWIDETGLLRMRDYIADNAGYRILKSKNLHVGINRPIAEAVKMAKKAPDAPARTPSPIAKTYHHQQPSTGFTSPYPNIRYTPVVRILPNSLPTQEDLSGKYSTTTTSRPILTSTGSTIYIPSTTQRPYDSSTSGLYDVPNSIPSSTPYENTIYNSPSTIGQNYSASSSIFNTFFPSSTARPVTATATTLYPEASLLPLPLPSPSPSQLPSAVASLNSNELDFRGYSGDPQYEHYTDDFKPFVNPYIFRNGPTYPLDQNGQTFTGYPSNHVSGDLDGQVQGSKYSVTNDGFRYYIPRAYHEETSLGDGNEKAGSFGYIDPFGIRRVVYYHATPGGGFKHRKNNRYVGFKAPPYDPNVY